jgi:NAD-specific glutamate dehydrogenase
VFNFNFIFSIIFSNNVPQISLILLENSSKKNQRKIFCKFLNTLGLFGIVERKSNKIPSKENFLKRDY